MNGCKFLREKGKELQWNHAELFPYFKSKIKPFMIEVKNTCCNMLGFFHSIRNYELQLTASVERHYELFIDIYHYQQFIDIDDDIIPSIEVQLFWISHALNPVEYYRDCWAKYKKILNVNIKAIPDDSSTNHFENYVNSKLNTNAFAPITTSIKTLSNNTSINTKEFQQTWFIHNLHMKSSVYQQMEFINKLNFIQYHNRINDRDIHKAMHRYCKFLYIMALPSDKRPPICVPSLDIDLIWHSHILNFENYYAMSRYLFPQIQIIPHNHCMNPTQQNRNKKLTQIFWDKIFGDEDYLNGRPFYIIYHKKKYAQHKRRKRIRNQTPRRPKPPIILEETSTDSVCAPSMVCVPSHSPRSGTERVFKITRTRSGEEMEEKRSDTNEENVETEVNTQMLMDGENEGNCCSYCELYMECCRWTFKAHQQQSMCIICGLSICVIFALVLFGAFLFIPSFPNAVTVHLYENNVFINADSTIHFDTLIDYQFNNVFDDDREFDLLKSISYGIDGIEYDIISFDGKYDDTNGDYTVRQPYLQENGYYYVQMGAVSVSDESKQLVRLNYTLSSSYFCCNDVECTEIGLLMPWINEWQYSVDIEEFNMNIYHDNVMDLYGIDSSWSGYEQDGVFSISKSTLDTKRNLNVYFTLLNNEQSLIKTNGSMEQCDEQLKYFIVESVEYENEYKQRMVSMSDYVLISLSTVLFMSCACYGCWWIFFLFDNSFCCDLCTVFVAK